MYYDTKGSVTGGPDLPPIFQIDFVPVGGAEIGRITPLEALPLSHLYFCDGCSRIVSRRDLAEDVDSYYCPHCLENMPSSEAMLYGMRCSKCWECPLCFCTLTVCSIQVKDGAVSGQSMSYYLACSYCRWSSKGRLECAQPEQLIQTIISLERESEPKQRMTELVDCFRSRAQEQQRGKELAQRLVRRSTMARSSFAASALSAYASRRYSTHMMASGGKGLQRGSPPAVDAQEGDSGRWRLELLQDKLDRREKAHKDLRYEARAKSLHSGSAKTKESAEGDDAASEGTGSTSPSTAAFSPSRRTSHRPSPVSGSGSGDAPVLHGMSVDELLAAHTSEGSGGLGMGASSLMERMNTQIEQTNAQMTLMHKLQQVSYGYQRLDPKAVSAVLPPGVFRTGYAQLEAPALQSDAWTLLPVRMPLLTKRSRRCRLLAKPEAGSHAKFADEIGKPCGKIVVKPQINPCSNPPFQKNNSAVSFVPMFSPFMWKAETGDVVISGQPGVEHKREKNLLPGESCELYFIVANPLDSEMQVSFDPVAFNPSSHPKAADCPLVTEQNVEVLSGEFKTEIDKFNDLSDVDDKIEESDKNKELREKDNKEVIANRKLHKLLCRIVFKRVEDGKIDSPWVFYARLGLAFTDASSAKHEVDCVVRFAAPTRLAKKPETSAEAQRRKALLEAGQI